MLTFILKKEWFDKIKRGEKTVEYREITDYWQKRIINFSVKANEGKGRFIQFRRGYTRETLTALVTNIESMMGDNTDLKVHKRVFAIKFRLVTKRRAK